MISFIVAALWNRTGHYIFVLWFFLSSFFLFSSPILSGRRLDVYHTSTRCGSMVDNIIRLSANLECRSEMCCTRLAGNTGCKISPKIAIWASSHNFVCMYLRNWGTYRQSGKKSVKRKSLMRMSPEYGKFWPIGGWHRLASLGHPSKFQPVSRVGFVIAVTSLNGGQPNFARCLAVSWTGTLYIHRESKKRVPP